MLLRILLLNILFLLSVHAYLVILLISPSAHASGLKVVEFDFSQKPGVSNLPTSDKFFLTYKESLLLDIDYHSLSNFEKKLGSLRSSSKDDIRYVNVSMFPEFGLSKGDEIQFFNSHTGKVEVHKVNERVAFKMMRSPFDDDKVYASFNVILTDPKIFHQFDHLDTYKFQHIAFKGHTFQLRARPMTRGEVKPLSLDDSENKELIEFYLAKSSPRLKTTNIKIYEILVADKKLIKFQNTKTADNSYFFKVGDKNYLYWRQPPTDYAYFSLYGDVVEGAELTAVLDFNNTHYIVLFFRDRVETYPAGKGIYRPK